MKNVNGFSLVEMAIVLVIVGLLLGGGLTIFTTQQELRHVQETTALLNEARDALIGFAITNGRLPCPAPATTATGAAGAGLEPTPILAGGCANNAGVLPWATLGINETDAWGNRYTYRVTQGFTATASPFTLSSLGNMTINNTAPLGGNPISLTTIPVVVLSHGKNGNGAYNTQGTQLPLGADVDEQANQLTGGGTTTANTIFRSGTPTGTFDDLVIWISPNILFNRMVAAGVLP